MTMATCTTIITSTPIVQAIQPENRTRTGIITHRCGTSTRTIQICITDMGMFTPREVPHIRMVSDNMITEEFNKPLY